MAEFIFEFDLEKGEISKDTVGNYAVRYYKSKKGIFVEIGDGYRHEMNLKAKYWNKILRIVRDNEIDKTGIEAITKGLMAHCLPEEYEGNLISAIRAGIVKEIE